MPNFVILMTENDGAWGRLSKAAQGRLLKKYYAWVAGMKKKNQLRGGEAIGGGGRVLRKSGGRVAESRFTATKDVLTGYFIVEAKNLGAAAKIARRCPALGHGETVTVRPVGHV